MNKNKGPKFQKIVHSNRIKIKEQNFRKSFTQTFTYLKNPGIEIFPGVMSGNPYLTSQVFQRIKIIYHNHYVISNTMTHDKINIQWRKNKHFVCTQHNRFQDSTPTLTN